MKTKLKLVLALTLSTLLPSCVRFVPPGQPVAVRSIWKLDKKLESVTVTKRKTGYCQARIWQGPENTPANVQMVSDYAASVYEKTGHVPSEQALTSKFGFRAQARWIDTPDKVVGQITVRPDEVPASIRARFQ